MSFGAQDIANGMEIYNRRSVGLGPTVTATGGGAVLDCQGLQRIGNRPCLLPFTWLMGQKPCLFCLVSNWLVHNFDFAQLLDVGCNFVATPFPRYLIIFLH